MKKIWWSFIGMVAIVVFSLYGAKAYKRYYLFDFKRPEGMSQSSYLKIKEKIKLDPSKHGVVYEFAVSKDGQSVWLATNIQGNGSMTLKIASIPDKILSKESVRASSSAQYNKFIAKFSDFEFEKGTSIHSGYYVASVVGQNVQRKTGIFSTEELDNSIDLTGTIILGKYQQQYVLESRLNNFKELQLEEKLVVFDVLVQKYVTINALADTTMDLFKTHIAKIKKGRTQYKNFEVAFANQVGRVLKDMHDDNGKNFEDLKADRPQVADLYQKQQKFYEMLGKVGADMVDSIKKRTTIGARTRKKLIRHYTKEIKYITEQSNKFKKHALDSKEAVRPKKKVEVQEEVEP